MLGILLAPGDLILLTIEYKLKERAAVARLLFKPLNELDKD
jgi:hypothetical protein